VPLKKIKSNKEQQPVIVKAKLALKAYIHILQMKEVEIAVSICLIKKEECPQAALQM